MPDANSDERLSRVLFYGMVLLAYQMYRIFEPFLLPLGWAGVPVVVFFYPWHERRLSWFWKTPRRDCGQGERAVLE